MSNTVGYSLGCVTPVRYNLTQGEDATGNRLTYTLPGCPVEPSEPASIFLDLAGFTGAVPGLGTNRYDVDNPTPTFGDVLVYSAIGPTLLATIPLDGGLHDITEAARGEGESVGLFFVVRGDWKSGGGLRLLSTNPIIASSDGSVSRSWEANIGELDPETPWITCVVSSPFSVSPMDSCGTLVVGNTGSDSCVISLISNLPDPPSPEYSPTFVLQPVNQSVASGESVTFSVDVTGSPTLAVQWKKEGLDIAGATSNTFYIASVTESDAGSYTVVATNLAGSSISDAAVLTVEAPPPGDLFKDAVEITLPYHSSAESLEGYGSEPGEPAPIWVLPAPTRWYVFTAPSTGTVSISTLGSAGLDQDSAVAIYTGATLESLVLVGSNDDHDLDGGQYLSYLEVGVTAGVVYHVQLVAYSGSNVTDPFDLVVEMV